MVAMVANVVKFRNLFLYIIFFKLMSFVFADKLHFSSLNINNTIKSI